MVLYVYWMLEYKMVDEEIGLDCEELAGDFEVKIGRICGVD